MRDCALGVKKNADNMPQTNVPFDIMPRVIEYFGRNVERIQTCENSAWSAHDGSVEQVVPTLPPAVLEDIRNKFNEIMGTCDDALGQTPVENEQYKLIVGEDAKECFRGLREWVQNACMEKAFEKWSVELRRLAGNEKESPKNLNPVNLWHRDRFETFDIESEEARHHLYGVVTVIVYLRNRGSEDDQHMDRGNMGILVDDNKAVLFDIRKDCVIMFTDDVFHNPDNAMLERDCREIVILHGLYRKSGNDQNQLLIDYLKGEINAITVESTDPELAPESRMRLKTDLYMKEAELRRVEAELRRVESTGDAYRIVNIGA